MLSFPTFFGIPHFLMRATLSSPFYLPRSLCQYYMKSADYKAPFIRVPQGHTQASLCTVCSKKLEIYSRRKWKHVQKKNYDYDDDDDYGVCASCENVKKEQKRKNIASWGAIIHPIAAELNAPRNKGQCFTREDWHICDVIRTGKIGVGGLTDSVCYLISKRRVLSVLYLRFSIIIFCMWKSERTFLLKNRV